MSPIPHEDTDAMQRLVDTLFDGARNVTRLDVLTRAEILDLSDDIMRIVTLLPPGTYTRHRLCDQLNSAITAHGLGRTLGTVD